MRPDDSTNQTSSHSQLFLNSFKICSKNPHNDMSGTIHFQLGQLGSSFSSTRLTFYKSNLVFFSDIRFFGQTPCGVFAEKQIQTISDAVEDSFLKCRFSKPIFFSGDPFCVWLAECNSCYLDESVPCSRATPLGAALYIRLCSVLSLLVQFLLRFYFRK